MQTKPVVLFDIDYTLFDRNLFLESLFDSIGNFLKIEKREMTRIGQAAYGKTIAEFDYFKPKEFSSILVNAIGRSRDLQEIENIVMEKYDRPECLYEETLETVNEVSKIADIGIFSKGHKEFQGNKIKELKHLLHADHIYMGINKYETLPKIINKYKGKKLYLIDDLLDVLYLAKKLKDDIVTIWVKRGIYAENQEAIPGFKPYAEVENLAEVGRIVKSNL